MRTKLMSLGWAARRLRAPYRGLVSDGLVLAGLHSRNPAALVTGIVDFATTDPEGPIMARVLRSAAMDLALAAPFAGSCPEAPGPASRSEEHTSELQSLTNLVCRLLLEKKNNN